MMAPVHRINGHNADPSQGCVKLDPAKLLWNGIMLSGAMAAPFFANISAIILFFTTTYLTLLLGHSVGMHRIMIHRNADAVPALERGLILLGTWVGIGGPAQIIAVHDLRDWAQRHPACHDFFSHRRGYWRDVTWQLFYRFDFDMPPRVEIEPRYSEDRFYQHLSRHWRWHQIGLAAFLFSLGGLPFVLWGICARVAVSTVGHWSVTYVCHNPGPGRYSVINAGVQASDLGGAIAGFLTHGECWHSNHHAFPESARIGLYKGQIDPAARIIEWLAQMDLVTRIGQARPENRREDLLLRSD
jgi:fatty-acid desaturase